MSQPINEIQSKDVSEARTRQKELLQGKDTTAAHFIYWFSWFWAVTSSFYFFCVTFVPMPDKSQHFADIILGFLLGTTVATIIGYFYGNSKE
jgi:hypothetical protein